MGEGVTLVFWGGFRGGGGTRIDSYARYDTYITWAVGE